MQEVSAKKEAYRKADRERKKLASESIKYLEPKEYQLQSAEDRARSQRNRERKRNETIDLAVNATQTSTTTAKSKEPEQNAFSTIQAYQRSIKRAEKHLPFSPRKRLEVVGGLAQNFKLRIKLPGKRGRKNRNLQRIRKISYWIYLNVVTWHIQCEECWFDNLYNQFKDKGNSSEENSLASSDEENEESDVEEDFVTYQLWAREEGKIKKKAISKSGFWLALFWTTGLLGKCSRRWCCFLCY